jgi:hypothetical protein
MEQHIGVGKCDFDVVYEGSLSFLLLVNVCKNKCTVHCKTASDWWEWLVGGIGSGNDWGKIAALI